MLTLFQLLQIIKKSTEDWGQEEIEKFFNFLGFPKIIASNFKKNNIVGSVFRKKFQYEGQLSEYGFNDKFHRRKFWIWLTDERFLKSFDRLINETVTSQEKIFIEIMNSLENQYPSSYSVQGNATCFNLSDFNKALISQLAIKKKQNQNVKIKVNLRFKKFILPSQIRQAPRTPMGESIRKFSNWKIEFNNQKFDVCDELSVGSNQSNQIIIQGADAGNVHCIFIVQNDECKIIDKEQQSGTFVSQQQIYLTTNTVFFLENHQVEITDLMVRDDGTAQLKVKILDQFDDEQLTDFSVQLDENECPNFTIGPLSLGQDSDKLGVRCFSYGFKISLTTKRVIILPQPGVPYLMKKLAMGAMELLEAQQEILVGSSRNKLKLLFEDIN